MSVLGEDEFYISHCSHRFCHRDGNISIAVHSTVAGSTVWLEFVEEAVAIYLQGAAPHGKGFVTRTSVPPVAGATLLI